MRPAFMLVVLLSSLASAAVSPDAVTLHPDGAVVSRTVGGQCVNGVGRAVFSELPTTFEVSSLRAQASKGAEVQGVSASEKIQERSFSEERQRLENELIERESVVAAEARRIEAARSKKQRAHTLRESTRAFLQREAMVSSKPDTRKWTLALERVSAEIEEANALVRQAEGRQKEESERIAEIREQLARLEGGAPRRSLEVEVSALCQGPFEVSLSAFTPRARWSPVYEARAERQAKKVSLLAMAEISQGSGERWDSVSLTLSTALSRRQALPPEPQRLSVGASEKEEERKVLVGRQEEARHLSDLDAVEPGGAAVEDSGLSVRMKVPGRARVEADGRPTRVRIETLTVPAKFESRTVPRLLPAVFVAADLRNTAKWPLLPGPMELFADGAFLGRTRLERTAEGAQVELSFGLDESVTVRRVVLEEEAKEPGIFGSTRRLRYAYRFELVAAEGRAAKVKLSDQLPVSELDDVKVVVDPRKTTAGYTLVPEDGHVSWTVELPAGQTKSVELHFVVEIPSKYDSSGL